MASVYTRRTRLAASRDEVEYLKLSVVSLQQMIEEQREEIAQLRAALAQEEHNHLNRDNLMVAEIVRLHTEIYALNEKKNK